MQTLSAVGIGSLALDGLLVPPGFFGVTVVSGGSRGTIVPSTFEYLAVHFVLVCLMLMNVPRPHLCVLAAGMALSSSSNACVTHVD
eukprot:197221-Amphidinium_carterae.2